MFWLEFISEFCSYDKVVKYGAMGQHPREHTQQKNNEAALQSLHTKPVENKLLNLRELKTAALLDLIYCKIGF